jgi:hypothetical protein
MEAIVADNTASDEDQDWARDQLTWLPDDIEWYEDEVEYYADELYNIDYEIIRIAEEQELAREAAIEAEFNERQWRIEDALEWYEWAERDYFDAMNEVEVYKDLLSQIDQEADRRTYKEYEDLMLQAQMNISYLEANYETVQAEYNRLVRDESRFEELAAEDALQADLNIQTQEAEVIMESNKGDFDAIEGDV